MKIKIDEINRRAIIEINPKDFFLVKGNEDFPFALAYRIDRSYKGKVDDVSQPVIFFGEEEYNKLKGIIDEVL